MKKISQKFVLSLFFLLFVGMSSYSYGYYHLSYSDEKILLELISNRYSDTWGEGIYGFHFSSFDCSFIAEECVLALDYWDLRDGPEYSDEEICLIGATSGRSLFKNRSKRQMTKDLHYQLDECIDSLDY